MFNKNLIFILAFLTVFIFLNSSCAAEEISVNNFSSSLISASNLNDLLNEKKDKLKIIDLRSGAKYLLGHIPGAVHTVQNDFLDREAWVEGLMAEANSFSQFARKKGINNDSKIVIYGENDSQLPARLWWIFKFYGHQNVKILNKGYQSWADADYAQKMLPEKNKKGSFKVKIVNNSWLINSDTIAENLDNKNFIILDLRPAQEYNSEKKSEGAARKGKIPNSLNFDCSKLLKDDFTLKETAEIEKILADLGLKKDKQIVLVSNTGVTASYMFFILNGLDYKNLKLYDAAWLGWSHRSDLPVAVN